MRLAVIIDGAREQSCRYTLREAAAKVADEYDRRPGGFDWECRVATTGMCYRLPTECESKMIVEATRDAILNNRSAGETGRSEGGRDGR